MEAAGRSMAASKSQREIFKIIIVGGGIAGLAAMYYAIALRGPSREIIVLEQSKLNSEIGATISLQSNASKIVENQWGLGDALRKKGSMLDEEFRIYSTDGKLQTKIPLLSKKEYGGNRMVYHRIDLHDVLKESAVSIKGIGLPAIIRTSSTVVDCSPEEGTVTLKDGEVLQGDLIVGADGIKSTLRSYILREEVCAKPTGHSAYRLMVETSDLENEETFREIIDPRQSFTAIVMGYDRRMIMGPARNGEVYSMVAMVPDKNLDLESNSWTTKADLQELSQAFESFPEWSKAPFKHCKNIGLWQLRDIDPLPIWHRGCVILIGDAAHAMLPTQGQGASQAVEDAEALGTFFKTVDSQPSRAEVEEGLRRVFDCRYERATLIQGYSRQATQHATEKNETRIKMSPAEFMDYNCLYNGALDWIEKREPKNVSMTNGLATLRI